MKIQNKLTLIASITITAAIIIAVVAYITAMQVHERIENNRALQGVVKGVAELVILTHEHALQGNERTHTQWRRRHESLSEIMNTEHSTRSLEQDILSQISSHLERVRELFDALVQGRDSARQGVRGRNSQMVKLREELLVGQLLIAAQIMVNDSFRLTEISHEAITSIQESAGWLIVSLVFALTMLLVITTWLVGRSVALPVARLHQGMRVIGSGGLTHRVGTTTQDEIGDLSRTIDWMTASLQQNVDNLNTEISERKRAEEALQEIQRRLSTLLSNLPGMAYRCRNDRDWTMEFVSNGCINLTGYQSSDFVAKRKPSYAQLIHFEDREPVWDQVQAALRENKAFQLVYRIITAKGAERWVWEQGTGIYSADGDLRVIEGFITDITEHKQAEQALLVAKAEAEQANEAKSRFLAAASHDLRQPLQTISIINGILAKKIQDAEVLHIIGKQSDALRTIGGLLDTLLDISKLEGRGITPEIRVFPVDDLLDRLRVGSENRAQDKGISFRYVPCRCAVRSDPRLLERIVENLLSNAIRYTHTGKILLGCRRQGANLHIEVWDTGIGIPGDQLETIFEDYYQMNNPARDHSKGLGLGLAIVDRVARLLGHKIDVWSTPGKGSMFAIKVPIAHMKTVKWSRPEIQSLEVDAKSAAAILLVEDDRAVLDATRLFLELKGYRVMIAENFKEALDRLDYHAPDLIVSDYRLPGGATGVELIQFLQQATPRTLPAILITGDTTIDRHADKRAAQFQLLHKPVDPDELLALIQDTLSRASAKNGYSHMA